MIDTHAHIYAEEFDEDRSEVVQRAKNVGVATIILPNIDSESLPRMLELEAAYPGCCYACIGLHPTSVKEDSKEELQTVKSELARRSWTAIGEIGIDLYWDKTFLKEQIFVFQQQVEWALYYKLPIIIHVRDSFRETIDALTPFKNKGLKGVFHSFTGTLADAEEILSFEGFKLGINGIVTFKNSGLADTVRQIDLKHIVLETDAPYLTPVPFRGKRNESSYMRYVLQKLAEIYNLPIEQIDKITTSNAIELFSL